MKDISWNTIVKDDCMVFMKSMNDNCVDMILTDIPYNAVNRESNGLRNLDKENADILNIDLQELLSELYRLSRGQIIIFCGKEQFSEIFKFFSKKAGTTRMLIWQKSNPSPMNGQYVYLSGVENAVWFKPRGRKVFNAHCKNTVFKHSSGTRKIHPTQKNIELFKELIMDNTNKGELIFDPFMGSGTTAVAAMQLERNYIGCELDEEYYDKLVERVEKEKELV